MNTEQQKSILTLCLMAALADGGKDSREREALERITARLAAESGNADAFNAQQMYEDVIFGRASIDSLVATLTDADSKRLAYEMAVRVHIRARATREALLRRRSHDVDRHAEANLRPTHDARERAASEVPAADSGKSAQREHGRCDGDD